MDPLADSTNLIARVTFEQRAAAVSESARALPANDSRRVAALHELSKAAHAHKEVLRSLAAAEAALIYEPVRVRIRRR